MTGSELKKILYAAIPRKDTWSTGEAYGAFDVSNKQDYKKVLYCVTITRELEDYAEANGYDLIISHHPYHPIKKIPHFIFHTALDCCKDGLNDQWRDALGIKDPQHFDRNLGWGGEIEPIAFQGLVAKVKAFCGGVDGQTFCLEPDRKITSVVVCSGLGGLVVDQALTSNAECYILGEMCEPADQTGFAAVIETGHTNSEWIGIKLFHKLLPGVQIDLAPKEVDYFGCEHFQNRASERLKVGK